MPSDIWLSGSFKFGQFRTHAHLIQQTKPSAIVQHSSMHFTKRLLCSLSAPNDSGNCVHKEHCSSSTFQYNKDHDRGIVEEVFELGHSPIPFSGGYSPLNSSLCDIR